MSRKPEPVHAVTVLEMNLEQFPEAQSILWELGETLEAKGDREAALAAFQKGLAVDPGEGFARFFQQKIDALGRR